MTKVDKLFRVITSCKTPEQLEVARAYTELWYEQFLRNANPTPKEDAQEMQRLIHDVTLSTMKKIEGDW